LNAAAAHRVTTDSVAHPPPVSHGTSGAVLAFDFGEQRIGVAVGHTAVGIAHPLTTLHAPDKKTRYTAIAALIAEWRPALLVVGLPLHLDGSEHELSRLARKFARELGGRFSLPVELVDERLTSVAAETTLLEAGVASYKRKPLLDQVAAQHILQAYLDERSRRARMGNAHQ
jgi:putative Holliday junction resolvase